MTRREVQRRNAETRRAAEILFWQRQAAKAEKPGRCRDQSRVMARMVLGAR